MRQPDGLEKYSHINLEKLKRLHIVSSPPPQQRLKSHLGKILYAHNSCFFDSVITALMFGHGSTFMQIVDAKTEFLFENPIASGFSATPEVFNAKGLLLRASLITLYNKLLSGYNVHCPAVTTTIMTTVTDDNGDANPRWLLGDCLERQEISSGHQQHASMTYATLAIFYPELTPRIPQKFWRNGSKRLKHISSMITFTDLITTTTSDGSQTRGSGTETGGPAAGAAASVSFAVMQQIHKMNNLHLLQKRDEIDVEYRSIFIDIISSQPNISFENAKKETLQRKLYLGVAWKMFSPNAHFVAISNETFQLTDYNTQSFPTSIPQRNGPPLTLFAILVHHGVAQAQMQGEMVLNSMTSGHWTTLMRISTETWVHYDDLVSTVQYTEIPFAAVLEKLKPTDVQRPGLLLYNRKP